MTRGDPPTQIEELSVNRVMLLPPSESRAELAQPGAGRIHEKSNVG